MPLLQLLNQTAWVIWRSDSTEEDDYGDLIPIEVQAEVKCEVQQRSRDEAPQGDTSQTEWIGIFPPDFADLDSSDALIVEELGEFELVGDPWPARNPRTRETSHVEATLRRTAGPGAGS